ncbi:hypothetical protein [Oceanobacillus sp. CAU 1775]
MKNNFFIVWFILILTLILSAGCTNASDKPATISANSDSEYVKTFDELALGILFDFDFMLQEADRKWVNLWVERYVYGEKDSEPLIRLYYGDSPDEVDKGNLGFGVINPNSDNASVFLYGPSVSMHSKTIDMPEQTDRFASWESAIGDKKIDLEIGETKILAVYRESEGNSMRMVDYQDEDDVNRMIKQDSMVFLLKIEIEDKN